MTKISRRGLGGGRYRGIKQSLISPGNVERFIEDDYGTKTGFCSGMQGKIK